MADENELLLRLKAVDELSPVMVKAMEVMASSAAKMTESLEKLNEKETESTTTHEHAGLGLLNLNAAVELTEKAVELLKVGFEFLVETVKKSIETAVEAEKAHNKLTGALVTSGNYTEKAAESLEGYVKATSQATGASSEFIEKAVATGLQMGLNIEQAKGLEEASRKLAASQGIDLNEALSLIQGSLTGQSRGLAKVLPQIKELTQEQLKHGGAISIVSKSLDEQYKLYQGSYSAAVTKASTSLSNIYEAIGKTMTSNKALSSVISSISGMFDKLSGYVDENKKSITSFVSDAVIIAIDALRYLTLGMDVLYKSLKVLGQYIEVPFKILNATIAATQAVMKKDLVGAAKIMKDGVVNSFVDIQKVATDDTAFTKFGNMLDDVKFKAVAASKESAEAHDKATQEILTNNSKQAKSHKMVQDSYAGIFIGTKMAQEDLKGEVQLRDKNLKDFTEYLDGRKRIAISKATEQQMELHKVQAEVMTGATGGGGEAAAAQVAIDTERKKQSDIAALYLQGVVSAEQYSQDLLGSQQRLAVAELTLANAHRSAMEQAMGQTPEAFEMRRNDQEQQFMLNLQQRIQQAQTMGATEAEISAMRLEADAELKAALVDSDIAYYEQQATMQEKAGNDWSAFLNRMQAEQKKSGDIMGTLKAVEGTKVYGATTKTLGSLATLMSSHNRKQFEIGKAAAIAQAGVQTFLAATEAFASLAGIPFVGPILGGIAAAAAVAAGMVQIQNIKSQKFQEGGQADSGMSSIPQNLDGKSFVLSAGERVVQPTANKDLTDFLNKEKTGNASGGGNISVTLNYSGAGGQEDARKMADIVVKQIREMSERGQPILNAKGVVGL